MAGRHLVLAGDHAGRGVQLLDLAHLGPLGQRDDPAGGPGPGGAARTVQVVLVIVRRVELHHQVHVVDVDAAGGHVGGDQDAGVPGGERVERPLPLVLVPVAVDGVGADPGPGKLLGQPVRAVLGADEEQGPSRPAGELRRDRHLVRVGQHQQQVLGDDGVRRRGHRVQRRVAHVRGHQLADAAVQRGGEQHPLAAGRRGVEDAGHGGHEAEVGHVVRLVEDGDLDVVERAGAALHQVDEPPGRGDHEVGVPDPVDLPADRDAAVHGGDAHADPLAERAQHVGDLLREFPGRDQDQAARGPLALALPARGEPGQQRQAEGQRLARAGLGAAEHVPAGQGVRQGPGLDRERLVDAGRLQLADQAVVEAEGGERGGLGRRRGGRGGQGRLQGGVRIGRLRAGRRDRPSPAGRARPGPGRGRMTPAGAVNCAACMNSKYWYGGRMRYKRQV